MRPDSTEQATLNKIGPTARVLAGIFGVALLIAGTVGLPVAVWLGTGRAGSTSWWAIAGAGGIAVSGLYCGLLFLKAAKTGESPPWT